MLTTMQSELHNLLTDIRDALASCYDGYRQNTTENSTTTPEPTYGFSACECRSCSR